MPQASIQLTILLHLNQLHMSASNKASPVHHTWDIRHGKIQRDTTKSRQLHLDSAGPTSSGPINAN
jgi:hypothetical protein